MKALFIFIASLLTSFSSSAYSKLNNSNEYRQLTKNIRAAASFKVLLPNGENLDFNYQLSLGEPIYNIPLINPVHLGSLNDEISIGFWDRIRTTDDSSLLIGNDKLPITCVFVRGQDNRSISGLSPLFPKFLMEVYLVVGDYTCTGPINPGWPNGGGRKETWDTYIYYKIKDPTIMLPTEALLRLRWNEFNVILNL